MAHTSIKLYLSAICQLQIEQGLPDPFKTPMPMLEQVVKGIKVRQGKDGRIPRRKLSITPDILRRIRSSWETRKEEPKLLCYGQPAQYTFLGVCTQVKLPFHPVTHFIPVITLHGKISLSIAVKIQHSCS